jgi:hypothetical protein
MGIVIVATALYRAGKAMAVFLITGGSMTEENDRRNRSNFSEVGLALLDGPAWWFEKIRTLTVKAICSTQESLFLLSILV